MKRSLTWALGAIGAVVAGVLIWFFATTGIDESTADVTAPTLAAVAETTVEETTDDAPSTDASVSEPTSDTTAGDDLYGPGAEEPVPGTEAQGGGSEDEVSESTEAVAPAGGTIFALADDSSVTFELGEVLRGQDVQVVATNSEVEGQIRVDASDLGNVELGTIVIGAQTFETDSSNRDRAIRGPILDASTFPEITFVPTSVDGLSGPAQLGEPVSFTITGDLTIRDITQPVTFDATATLESDDLVEGRASAVVSRESFGLTIPSVAAVADVSDEVTISIDLVATPA